MDTTIENEFLKAVVHSKGAELASLVCGSKNLIWDIDPAFWNKTSPVLFPIVGALKDGSYTSGAATYHLPRHGFARDMEFEVKHQTENSVTFLLHSSKETLSKYPFDFEFRITYTLENKKLLVKYEVTNLSENIMYYSLGAHPAFSLKGEIEDYSLKFDHDTPLVSWQLENDVFSGKTAEIPLVGHILPLNYQLFENDAIVLKDNTTTSLTVLYQNQPQFRVDFSDFPYLGIWTKKEAPFLCIEPWQGIADVHNTSGKIEEKEGIRALDPKHSEEFEWTVEVLA
ncbi:aldose 1-epimerase family protein [Weeksellaceae bacterium A-14]